MVLFGHLPSKEIKEKGDILNVHENLFLLLAIPLCRHVFPSSCPLCSS
jgi:hypothetical protein